MLPIDETDRPVKHTAYTPMNIVNATIPMAHHVKNIYGHSIDISRLDQKQNTDNDLLSTGQKNNPKNTQKLV